MTGLKDRIIFGSATSLAITSDGATAPYELLLACVALMVDMAGSDQSIAAEEAQQVCKNLGAEFELPEERIAPLVTAAVKARKQPGAQEGFISVINKYFDAQQKTLLFALLWKVVEADGKVDTSEKRLSAELQHRLELTDAQVSEAKRIAAADFDL